MSALPPTHGDRRRLPRDQFRQPQPSLAARSVPVDRLFDVPTREREEDVVQRRLPHLDVVHEYACRIKRPHDGGGEPSRSVHARTQPPAVVTHVDPPRHQWCDRTNRLGRVGSASVTSKRAVRLASFSSWGVPSAITRPWSTTTMWWASVVGLLQVLRRQQDGDSLSDQFPDGLPHPLAAGRVEPCRRLVEEQDRWPRDQRRRQVESPAHAARVALHHPVGGECQLELVQQLDRPGPRRRGPCRRARPPGRGSGARSAGDRAWRPGRRPRCGGAPRRGAAATSMPATVARPASGRASVVRMRTAVVLPAPFGPSSPRIDPAGTPKSTPASAWVSP